MSLLLLQSMVTGAHGAVGAAAAGLAMEVKSVAIEHVTTPSQPMGVEHVLEQTQRFRNAAQGAVLVRPI